MSWPSETAKAASGFEFAPEDKRKFAAALLKTPKDPLTAARSVFGTSSWALGKASYVATVWPDDPEVLLLKQELSEATDIEDLPSKAEAARRVWEWTEDGSRVTKEKTEAMRVYLEMRGFIEKPSAAVATATVTMPPVITFVLDDDNDTESSSADTEAV